MDRKLGDQLLKEKEKEKENKATTSDREYHSHEVRVT